MKDKPFFCEIPGCRFKSFETARDLHMHQARLHSIHQKKKKQLPKRFCKCGVELEKQKRLCAGCRVKMHRLSQIKKNEKIRNDRKLKKLSKGT